MVSHTRDPKDHDSHRCEKRLKKETPVCSQNIPPSQNSEMMAFLFWNLSYPNKIANTLSTCEQTLPKCKTNRISNKRAFLTKATFFPWSFRYFLRTLGDNFLTKITQRCRREGASRCKTIRHIQRRWRSEIADFCCLPWPNIS